MLVPWSPRIAVRGRLRAVESLMQNVYNKVSHSGSTGLLLLWNQHFYWWTGQDLNPPPPRCKRGALPDELPALLVLSIK